MPEKPIEGGIPKAYDPSGNASKELLQFEAECWEMASRLEPYPTGEALRRAYWRALISSGVGPDLDYEMEDCFKDYLNSLPLMAIFPTIFPELFYSKSPEDMEPNESVDSGPQPQLLPATPEMFPRQGFRVPECVYDQPGLSIIEHLTQVIDKAVLFEQQLQFLSCRRRFSTTKEGTWDGFQEVHWVGISFVSSMEARLSM